MKFNADDIRDLFKWENVEGFEVVEEGDWISGGKYEHAELIFKYEDKFYMAEDFRSGSYHTDYYYGSDDWTGEIECPEVVAKEITVIDWVAV